MLQTPRPVIATPPYNNPVVFSLFCTAIHYSNPLLSNDPHLKLD